MTRLSILGVAVLASYVGGSSAAWAKPRVVLAKIDGDTKGNVYDAVSSSLETDVSLVAQREVKKAFTKLEIDDLSDDKDVGKLEKAVSAKAVIVGSLDKKGEGMALHLKIYVKPAAKPKAFTVKFSNAGSEKFRKTLHDTIIDRLGDLGDDGGDDTASADPPKTQTQTQTQTKKKKNQQVDDSGGDDGTQAASTDDPPKKKKKKKVQSDGTDDAMTGTDDTTSGGDDGTGNPPKKKKKKVARQDPDDSGDGGGGDDGDGIVARVSIEPIHSANRDAVRVDTGVQFLGRTLSFASRNFPQAPKPYTNSPVPGAYVDGELFPFAFSNPKSFAAGIGIGFQYEKTLSLKLQTTDPTSGNVLSAAANQQNFEVDARYRILFGKRATAPSLTLAVGYGQRAFVVDAPAANRMSFDIPDVAYTAILPTAELRFPVGTHVALYGGGGAMLITDAGPIEETQQYGQGRVIGIQANAGLDITFGRFAVKIEGDYAQVGFAFVGNGLQSIGRDGDPTTIDVGGAADVYYGGTVSLGVMY